MPGCKSRENEKQDQLALILPGQNLLLSHFFLKNKVVPSVLCFLLLFCYVAQKFTNSFDLIGIFI
jgi:hypothetical protein